MCQTLSYVLCMHYTSYTSKRTSEQVSLSSACPLSPRKEGSEKLQSSKRWNKDFNQVRVILLHLAVPQAKCYYVASILISCVLPLAACIPEGNTLLHLKSFQLNILPEEIHYSGHLDASFSLISPAEVSEVIVSHICMFPLVNLLSLLICGIRSSGQALRIHSSIPTHYKIIIYTNFFILLS